MCQKQHLLLLLIFMSTISSSLSQQLSEKELYTTFSKIYKRDQSNIHHDSIRSILIIENFEQINQLLEEDKIPDYKTLDLSKRTKKKLFWGFVLTFHHILQTKAELLLNPKTIAFYKEKSSVNNSLKKCLKLAMWNFNKSPSHYDYPFWNEELEKLFWFALKEWEIELDSPPLINSTSTK